MNPYANESRLLRWRRHFHLLTTAALPPVLAGVYYLCYWLRFEGQWSPRDVEAFWNSVAWVVAIQMLWFVGLRATRGWSRPVCFQDLMTLIEASTGALAVLGLARFVGTPMAAVPRGVLLMDWGATLVVLGGLRSSFRGAREVRWTLFSPPDRVRVLIAGAGELGASTLAMIRRIEQHRYHVVGFIASHRNQRGARIEGVPVLGGCGDVRRLVRRCRVRQILVAQGELSGDQIRVVLDRAREEGCDVQVLPDYRNLIEGNVVVVPRTVSIEDLLQRDPVKLDVDDIRRWIDGRVVLVTGSAGSIGSEICRQLLHFDPERIIAVDRAETGQFHLERELRSLADGRPIDVAIADVLDATRMRRLMMRDRPHVVFHAAAYKHVPLMESHPREAVRNIVAASQRLADMAREFRVESFVMISTDKAVNPTSVMGACKRTAELYVQSLAGASSTRFVTVRFGNVLDSAGSVVPLFREQIAAGGPVTVTHPDMRRFFMTIPEASQLVLEAGAIGRDGQILVLDMGKPVRIADLAADMIRLSGLRVGDDIAIEFVGLRPGEKLYEELHVPGERLAPTRHPKIIVADRRRPKVRDLHAAIADLERLADEAPEEIIGQLRRIVRGYRHEQATPPVKDAPALLKRAA